MAEEEVLAVSAPAPMDLHKRKHEDPEPGAQGVAVMAEQKVADLNLEMDGEEKDEEFPVDDVVDSSEAKRPRLDDKPDGLASEDEYLAEKQDELAEENAEGIAAADDQLANDQHSPEGIVAADNQMANEQQLTDDAPQGLNEDQLVTENEQKMGAQLTSADNSQPDYGQPPYSEGSFLENAENLYGDQLQKLAVEVPEQGDFASEQDPSESGTQTTSRKMEVPNNKVGVLIGKAGDTIKLLQYNSGAKIQITRDADADPRSTTRPVELIGTPESISKAEKLIKDVIAEADAGGSPSLVARGFTTTVAAGSVEQIQIQVPFEKVGLIIGKGGDTIKSLQTRSGARIQLIPQHPPDGDKSKERTVRVSGDRKQIELAKELIKEVMNQPIRPPSSSGNYNQQAYRPRGPGGTPQQWGGRAPHLGQQTPHEYQQRGTYPSQNQQYPPSYGNYPQRSSYGSGWEHRPPPMQQGPPPQTPPGGGYDYYGGQGGHGPVANVSASTPHMGPSHSQANYNYVQPRGPDYGHQPTPYSQTAPPHHQSYGHGQGQGYPEPNHGPSQQQQPPYGGHGTSQQGSYPDASVHQVYGYAPPQQQYNKPQPQPQPQPLPPYGVPSQGAPPPQSYTLPAASQPGDMQPYQAPVPSVQLHHYGQNVASQQSSYPYASSGLTHPPYGSAPVANDGYNQPSAAAGYPQPGYGQLAGQQQVPVYAQSAPPGAAAAAYGQYPSTQQLGYVDQAASAAAYGYQQGQADQAYAAAGQVYGAASGPPPGKQGYAQPAPAAAPAQGSYDQSGGYGSGPAGAAAAGPQPQSQPGYPQPQVQYDSSQMYGVAPAPAPAPTPAPAR
ncbi:hypothetical protein Nepgr_015957 [Nepenthes gracilis]|uniref:K Homology domain-containing protein n=1 Tax=Nepenthes gracilis TaxID=150966 RepID=A0AAD3XRT0_NEPGR|nr:hypothetical protein Nepgr_015957 [Nepenthes gracilis]